MAAASTMGLSPAFAHSTPSTSAREPVRVALMGGAHIHAPGFAETMAETDGIETKYVWDPDPEVAEERQEVTGGDIVDDYETILEDEAVEGVVICSETYRHEELALATADAGKHLFIEKPVGMNGDEAERIKEAVREAGVVFQTGYFMRSDGAHQLIRQLILEGTLGNITRLRLSNVHSGAIGDWFDPEWLWMTDLEQAGVGAFGDLGSHAVDLLLWFMDQDEVVACTSQIDTAIEQYPDCDEYGEGMITFASGAVATVAGGWVDHANPNTVEVSGTEGHARITDGDLYLTSEELNADGTEPWTDVPDDWPHAFDLFLEALLGTPEGKPLITPEEAAHTNRVVTALYEAHERGAWVEV